MVAGPFAFVGAELAASGEGRLSGLDPINVDEVVVSALGVDSAEVGDSIFGAGLITGFDARAASICFPSS